MSDDWFKDEWVTVDLGEKQYKNIPLFTTKSTKGHEGFLKILFVVLRVLRGEIGQ